MLTVSLNKGFDMNMSLRFPLLVLILAAAISGCGKKEEGAKAETQVVAKVNGKEISIHQLNFQLARAGNLSQEQLKEASKQLLARLVDQELFLQKAVEANLDRDPKVMQAIESAKREILAQAYVEQQMSSAKKPDQAAMDKFYAEHPELFEKRRIYRMQEMVVAAGKDKLADIEQGAKSAGDFNKIAEWLKQHDYKFSASANVRAAEQLPMELLPRLQQMKDGQMLIVPTRETINVVLLAASQDQPIDKGKAAPMIEKFLVAQGRNDVLKKSLEDLRAQAKIEYVGAFADAMPVAKNAAVAPPVSKKGAPAKNAPATDEHIDKGLAGL